MIVVRAVATNHLYGVPRRGAPSRQLRVGSTTEMGGKLSSLDSVLRRLAPGAPRPAVDWEIVLAVALLAAALVVGLSTASHYGISVDEFNADDYGPKALA